jgi:glycosyltransferase involved in cell wall biosynthesis
MRTIPNGIDLDVVTALATKADGAAMRARHGIGADEFVLLSVGRLEANKGFVRARLGAPACHGRGPSARTGSVAMDCGWVGAVPARAGTRHRRGRHRPRVVLAGRATDEGLHAWYEAASVFVHPTRYEGSSLVTLEAMAHETRGDCDTRRRSAGQSHTGLNGWLVKPTMRMSWPWAWTRR